MAQTAPPNDRRGGLKMVRRVQTLPIPLGLAKVSSSVWVARCRLPIWAGAMLARSDGDGFWRSA